MEIQTTGTKVLAWAQCAVCGLTQDEHTTDMHAFEPDEVQGQRAKILAETESAASGVNTGKPQKHPEGYSVEVWRGETRLASVYGATKQEAQARAMTVADAFRADTYDTNENEEAAEPETT